MAQGSPETKSWPTYRLAATIPGMRGAELITAPIDAEIAAHPDLVARGTSPGTSEASFASKAAAVYTFGLVGGFEDVTIGVRYSSRLPATQAEAIVKEIVKRHVPSTIEFAATVAEAFVDEVVVQTGRDVVTKVAEIKVAATPWVYVGAAVLVLALLVKVAR